MLVLCKKPRSWDHIVHYPIFWEIQEISNRRRCGSVNSGRRVHHSVIVIIDCVGCGMCVRVTSGKLEHEKMCTDAKKEENKLRAIEMSSAKSRS